MGEDEEENAPVSETDGVWKQVDTAMYHIGRLHDTTGRRARQKHKVVANETQRKHGHYENVRDK